MAVDQVEVDAVFRVMCQVISEVPPYDAGPGGVLLVKLLNVGPQYASLGYISPAPEQHIPWSPDAPPPTCGWF